MPTLWNLGEATFGMEGGSFPTPIVQVEIEVEVSHKLRKRYVVRQATF